jgi:hypothetical protein
LPVSRQKNAQTPQGVAKGVLFRKENDAEMIGLFPVKTGALYQKETLAMIFTSASPELFFML